MPRISTIKPEFSSSEKVKKCSRTARLLFILMWNFCDDAGIHPACYEQIKSEVFPRDNLTKEEIEKLIGELITNGLIEEYEAFGKRYWRVIEWDQPSSCEFEEVSDEEKQL